MTILPLLAALLSAPSDQKRLEAADRACLARLELGEIDAARATCGALDPADHPIAAYWRALLEKDSTRLRAALEPSRLARLEPPGKRLLLLAARYHFASGDTTRLGAVARQMRARFQRIPELDSLERLRKD